MRIHPPYGAKANARRRHQIVDDPHIRLTDDPHIEMQQMIVILVHRSGETVLNRYDRRIRLAPVERAKNLLEALIRNHRSPIAKQLPYRLLAKRPQLPLKPDFEFFQRPIVQPRRRSKPFCTGATRNPPPPPWV